MNSRLLINDIFRLNNKNFPGVWLGNPDPQTSSIYTKALGFKTQQQLHDYFSDDCRWICPEWDCYNHPGRKPMWDFYAGREKTSLGQPGFYADCNTIADINSFDWPKTKYLNYSKSLQAMNEVPHKAVFSGMWCCFFHVVADFFGMENYFVKMFTEPAIVEAVTERIVDFYLEANKILFTQADERFDIFFLGNDFGSQLDLLISLDLFKKYIIPSLEKLINQAKKYDKVVLLHSCGAIDKAIPFLIDLGVDALHPIQAKATDMNAKSLSKKYKNKLAFVGGLDTQDLLVNASSAQVKDEVYRLIELLGPNYVVSPSHEALLPNIPLKNVEAMFEAVHKCRQ